MKKFFCGPESFTPDLSPCVGESPEIANYFVAAGKCSVSAVNTQHCYYYCLYVMGQYCCLCVMLICIVCMVGLNSIGILTGGGLGRVVAHWIVNGRPDVDVCGFNVDRLHRYQSNPAYRRDRVAESLGNVYKCHYPYKVPQTARGAKRTAVFDRVAKEGAYFRAVSGYETADFYEVPGVLPPGGELQVANPDDPYSGSTINAGRSAAHLQYCWDRPSFWAYWEREHRACREGVCLIDMSFMSKFLVQGRDAGACLNR